MPLRERGTKLSRFSLPLGLILILGLAALFSACGKATPAPAPNPPAPSEATTTAPPEGKELYTAKCAVCHGSNGEGTAAGPAVAGHSMAAVKTQVRHPIGTMPAFSDSQLSEHDLDEIAEFIVRMGMAEVPIKDWEKQTRETLHHWMALLAIQNDDVEDAKHHLQDALAFIKEPMHKAATEEALELIAQGNLHDAEHEIEEMAGSKSPSGVTMQKFHLILAQRGIEDGDANRVKHHLEHFVINATIAEKEIAQEALELVEVGDLHEAEHEIEELLEMAD